MTPLERDDQHLDVIDSGVFSGELLEVPERRAQLLEYIGRWQRALGMLELSGELTIMGEHSASDMPPPDVTGLTMRRPDGRDVWLFGLTNEEVRALAPCFRAPIVIRAGGAT